MQIHRDHNEGQQIVLGDDGELISILSGPENEPKRKNEPYLQKLLRAAKLVALIGIPISILTLVVVLQAVGVFSPQPAQNTSVQNTFRQPAACSSPLTLYDLGSKFYYAPGTDSGKTSPDGRYALYSKLQDFPNLYLKDLQSGVERNLTSNDRNGAHYDGTLWSPNSRLIAFSFFNNGLVNVFLFNLDDNSIHSLTYFQIGSSAVPTAWFPNSDRLLYYVQGRQPGFYSIGVDGSDPERLSDDSGAGPANVSPDGEHIVFFHSTDQQAYVMDIHGLFKKKIVENFSSTLDPKWSADGKYIIFDGFIIVRDHSTYAGKYRIDSQSLNPVSLCLLANGITS